MLRTSGFWLIVAVAVPVMWMIWIYGGGHADERAPTVGVVVFVLSVALPAVVSGVLIGLGR